LSTLLADNGHDEVETTILVCVPIAVEMPKDVSSLELVETLAWVILLQFISTD
jgi:hypothetical protein